MFCDAGLVSTETDGQESLIVKCPRGLDHPANHRGQGAPHLPGSNSRWQVSSQGGEEPHWSGDGRELYYRWDTKMMVVPVEPGTTFQSAPARPLFDGLFNLRVESGMSYSFDPKSGRFLTIRPAEEASPPMSIRVALNWVPELARMVQGGK